jgi:DNA polymerase III subunit delta
MPSASPRPAAAVCLVWGDDDLGVEQRARQLYEEWCRQAGGMDHEIIDAAAANAGEAQRALGRLREALQTLPFFGRAKVIWLRHCNFLGDDRTAESKNVMEDLAGLAEELKSFPWDNVRLLLSAGKVDRRKTFYKTLEKLGPVEAFAALSLDDKDWADKAEAVVLRAMQALKKSLSDEALARFVNQVGPNLRQLANESEKLALYVGPREAIETADVEAVVTCNKQTRAFAVADALGERDLPRALACLDRELWMMQFDRDKSEIGILAGLISKVRSMILLKELAREKWIEPGRKPNYAGFKAQLDRIPAERMPEDRRYSPKGLHPFVLFNSLSHAERYTLEELVRAMDLLLECNRALVSSGLEEKLVLQQALIQIVRRPEGSGVRRPGHHPAAEAAQV